MAKDLGAIYWAPPAEQAEQHLVKFEATWDAFYGPIGNLQRRHGAGIVPFRFSGASPPGDSHDDVVESLRLTLRKLIKTRRLEVCCIWDCKTLPSAELANGDRMATAITIRGRTYTKSKTLP